MVHLFIIRIDSFLKTYGHRRKHLFRGIFSVGILHVDIILIFFHNAVIDDKRRHCLEKIH